MFDLHHLSLPTTQQGMYRDENRPTRMYYASKHCVPNKAHQPGSALIETVTLQELSSPTQLSPDSGL